MAKRTPEQWLELLQQHKQSRLTVAQFCRENHLSESSFYLKLKKFRETHSPLSTFVAAKPVPSVAPCARVDVRATSQGCTILLQHGQCRLTCSDTTSPEWLAVLIKSLS